MIQHLPKTLYLLLRTNILECGSQFLNKPLKKFINYHYDYRNLRNRLNRLLAFISYAVNNSLPLDQNVQHQRVHRTIPVYLHVPGD